MSTYIIEREPNKYGGNQQAYVEEVNGIVASTTEAFRVAVESKQDLIQLFHQTLASFGEARHRIAMEHGSEDAEFFGIRRDYQESFASPCSMTHLGGPYEEYGKRLLSVFQKQLMTMKHSVKAFQQTESEISFEKCLERRSTMEFSLLTFEALRKWLPTDTREEYQRLCKLCSFAENPSKVGNLISLTVNRDFMQKLKKVSIEDYKHLKLILIMERIREEFEGKKSDWLVVTTRSEVDGRMCALSQYITWLYRDCVSDPVEKMSEASVITHIYQDPFLVETMLRDIASIFKKAIEWNGEKIGDLKDQVALFRYELAHAMPFQRGSSAIAEWFERAIYLYHGMPITYTPEKMVDLEALTSSLKEFVDNYDSLIQLEKT